MTPNQKIFCDEWLKSRNATDSYLTAFPSCTNRGSAGVEGCKLLKNPKITTYINKKLDELSENAGLTVQRILEEEARISLADIRPYPLHWLGY